jgi:hypothetical protein
MGSKDARSSLILTKIVYEDHGGIGVVVQQQNHRQSFSVPDIDPATA